MTGPIFYGDLAAWWPRLSEVEDYEEEATFAGALLAGGESPARTVLELGSGGGHNAFYLKRQFALTLVDLSPDMLAVSRRLNPECEHLVGDMRTVRLDRTFDAVFVHDAITYMTTAADLTAAMATAAAHCRPGGQVVLMPDEITETFEPSTDHGGSDNEADGGGARYLSWSWDPDPTDTWIQTEYAFLIRHADGTVTSAHETHRTGLFPRATWLALMESVGLMPWTVTEETGEDRQPRELFLGTKV